MITHRDRHRRAPRPQRHSRQRVAHLPRPVPAMNRVAVPQLAVEVMAPAFDRPVVQHRARVIHARRDRHRRAPHPQRNSRQRVAHLPRTVPAINRVAVPQLAVAVRAPALERPVVQHRARVRIARRDRHRRAPHPQRNSRQRVAHLPRTVPAINRVAVPQLAVAVPTPALD